MPRLEFEPGWLMGVFRRNRQLAARTPVEFGGHATQGRWNAYTLLRENLRAAIGEYRPEGWRWSDYDLIEAVTEMRERLKLLEAEEQRW